MLAHLRCDDAGERADLLRTAGLDTGAWHGLPICHQQPGRTSDVLDAVSAAQHFCRAALNHPGLHGQAKRGAGSDGP